MAEVPVLARVADAAVLQRMADAAVLQRMADAAEAVRDAREVLCSQRAWAVAGGMA